MLLNTKARAFVWEPVKVFGRQYQWSSSYSPTTAMALAFVQEKPLGCLNLWYDSQGNFYFLTVLLCIQISKTKDYASRTCYRCPATGRQKIVLELMHFSLEKWLICGNRKMQIKYSSLLCMNSELCFTLDATRKAFQIWSAFLRTSLYFSSWEAIWLTRADPFCSGSCNIHCWNITSNRQIKCKNSSFVHDSCT